MPPQSCTEPAKALPSIGPDAEVVIEELIVYGVELGVARNQCAAALKEISTK